MRVLLLVVPVALAVLAVRTHVDPDEAITGTIDSIPNLPSTPERTEIVMSKPARIDTKPELPPELSISPGPRKPAEAMTISCPANFDPPTVTIDTTSAVDKVLGAKSEDYVNASLCAGECFDLLYQYAIPVSITKDRPRGFGMSYSSKRI